MFDSYKLEIPFNIVFSAEKLVRQNVVLHMCVLLLASRCAFLDLDIYYLHFQENWKVRFNHS